MPPLTPPVFTGLQVFIEDQLPDLARMMFGSDLVKESCIAWYRDAQKREPCLNVYTAGGTFAKHTDGKLLARPQRVCAHTLAFEHPHTHLLRWFLVPEPD